jgi:hypothetical protein
MASELIYKGTGLWRMQDVLTKSNRDEWFQKLETIVASEDMSFLLTKSLNEYLTVKETERDTEPGQD